MELLKFLTPGLLLGICLCLLGAGLCRTAVLIQGAFEARRRQGRTDEGWSMLLRSDLVPAVAVIAAPPDASAASRQFVRRLLNLHAGNPEIILVLDGPTAAELAVWKEDFHLQTTFREVKTVLATKPLRALYVSTEPIQLVVVDKERGGRADGLNAGLNVARAPVIATVDPDARFAEESLLGLLRPMLANPQETLAVCAVAPGQAAPGLASRFYRLGFLRTWLGRCAGMAASNTFLPAPGTFALWSREAVVRAEGFRSGPLEMAIHLHALGRAQRRPYQIVFLPDALSRPGTPGDYAAVREAAARDQMEVGAALRFHQSFLMGFGSLGWLALPGLLASRLLLPLLETAALMVGAAALATGWVGARELALLIAVPMMGEVLVSMTAVLLERMAWEGDAEPGEVAALFFSAVAENLGYRQWRNLWMVCDLFRGFATRAPGVK